MDNRNLFQTNSTSVELDLESVMCLGEDALLNDIMASIAEPRPAYSVVSRIITVLVDKGLVKVCRPVNTLVSDEVREGEVLAKIDSHLSSNSSFYTSGDCGIIAFSKCLGENARLVSFIIKKYKGKKYIDLVNEKKIEIAKQILRNDLNGDLIIDAVYDNVGFKSSSSFYRNFKKLVGMTPTEYRNNLKLTDL